MAAATIITFSVITMGNRVSADRILTPGHTGLNRRDASSDSMHVYYETGKGSFGNKDGWKSKGQMTTSSDDNRICSISVKLSGNEYTGGIRYSVLLKGSKKWTGWISDGKTAGNKKGSKHLEAVRIELTGDVAKHYDVCYRTLVDSYGWLSWAKNGEVSGNVGYSKKMEAIQIVLVAKDSGLPGNVAGIASKNEKPAVIKESASSPGAEYKAEIGPSYPLKYENDAVYCYDPSTGEKKTGWIRINGLTYYFDPEKDGQLTEFSVNDVFSKAVFIGNSTSDGLNGYFNSKGKGYLGGPRVAARTSYTFNSDKNRLDGYMLEYKGDQYQAKEIVKKIGARYAFIMMGTNDLMGASASSVAKKYGSYIEGIQKANPGVVIYIQSTTPRRGKRNADKLSNEKIDELNRLMSEYADSHENVFYIDISTGLKDDDGNMKQEYSYDGYVHLNKNGYAAWIDTVVDYVRNRYIEKAAADAKASNAERPEAG